MYTNLNDQHQFNEVKDYIAEIREQELMSKRVSKYIASFVYFDKSLTVLSALSGRICIASFATVIAAPVGIASVSFRFAFSITTGIIKKN